MRNLKKWYQKIISTLIILIFSFSLIPVPAFAAGIASGSDGIPDLGGTVDFITYTSGSVTTNDWMLYAKDDTYAYIITKDAVATSKFNSWTSSGNTYGTSQLHNVVKNLENSWSSNALWSKADGNGKNYIKSTTASDSAVAGDKLYIISQTEADGSKSSATAGSGTDYSSWFTSYGHRVAKYNNTGVDYWQRTPYVSTIDPTDNSFALIIDTSGTTGRGYWVTENIGVRPALQIDLKSSLFQPYLFSTAEGGKNSVSVGAGFALPDAEASTLTHRTVRVDSTSAPTEVTVTQTAISEAVDDRAATAGTGGTVDLTTQLKTKKDVRVSYDAFDNTTYIDNIAAVVEDSSGNIVNYAKLATGATVNSALSDSLVPADNLADGTYTMHVYGEKINGTRESQYDSTSALADAASAYVNASFTLETTYKNYGTLTSGYKDKGLTTVLGNDFNLSFESGTYDTKITTEAATGGATINAGPGGTTLSGNMTIGANLNTSGAFSLSGNNEINATVAATDSSTLTISGGTTNVSSTGSIANNVSIANGAVVNSQYAALQNDIANNGTWNLTDTSAVIINKAVTGTGTLNLNSDTILDTSAVLTQQNVAVAANKTLTVTDDKTLGSLTLGANAMLEMKSGTPAYNTLTVGSLDATAGAKLSFEAKIDGTATPEITTDKIAAGSAIGTLTLGSVNISLANDSTTPVGTEKTFELVTNAADNFVINGTATATSEGYMYNFTQDTTNKGMLKAKKDYAGTLADIVQNNTVASYAMGNIATYSMIGDYATAENLGNLTRVDATPGTQGGSTVRNFTINGNGHILSTSAAGKGGITLVNSGDTLSLTNITVDGFATAVTNCAGATVNADGVTVQNTDASVASNIVNSGTLNLNGTASSFDRGITNNGTLNINTAAANWGTNGITGTTGKTNINVSTTLSDSAVIWQKDIAISSGASLNAAAGNIKGQITVQNGGETILRAGELDLGTGNNISGGKITIAGGVTANADSLASTGGITNDGYRLTLAGGNVTDNILGAGTASVTGTVTVADGKTIANTVTNTGTLNSKYAALTNAASITNSGNWNLTDTGVVTINKTVTGTNGTLNLSSDTTIAANITGQTVKVADGKTLTGTNFLNDADNSITIGTGSLLDMATINGTGAVKLNNFTADSTIGSKIKATAALSDTPGASTMDKITVLNTASGKLAFDSIKLTSGLSGTVGAKTQVAFVTTEGTGSIGSFILETKEVYLGQYKYVFTQNGTNLGMFDVEKETGYYLDSVIDGSGGEETKKITEYSLDEEQIASKNLGELNTEQRDSFTINGNGNGISGNNSQFEGMSLNGSKNETLNLNNLTMREYNGFAVNNSENSTVNADGVTMENNSGLDYINDGTLNFTGNASSLDKGISDSAGDGSKGTTIIAATVDTKEDTQIIQQNVTISENGRLKNKGMLKTKDGISNSGTLENEGTVNANVINKTGATLDNAGTINGKLTNKNGATGINSGTIAGGLDNNGSFTNSKPNGSIAGNVINRKNGVLNNDGSITGDVTNDGTIIATEGSRTGGKVTNKETGVIKNEGTIGKDLVNYGSYISEKGTVNGKFINYKKDTEGAKTAGNFAVQANANSFKGGVENSGDMWLTGGTLTSAVTSTGTLGFTNAKTTINAPVAVSGTLAFCLDLFNIGDTLVDATANPIDLTNVTAVDLY